MKTYRALAHLPSYLFNWLRQGKHVWRYLGSALVIALALQTVTPAYAQTQAPSDTGDVPDSTNHAGVKMTTYPGAVVANFPTVFADPAGISGPIHWTPTKDAWLGPKVSGEADADKLPDMDGVTNIDPTTNVADRDNYDDGVLLSTLKLVQCGQTTFRYNVNVATPGTARYVNVWFDFNRDGDWNDTLRCTTATGAVYSLSEWAVQNQAISSALAAGSYNFTTPAFWSANPPNIERPLWMRITISEQKAPLVPGQSYADGRGPAKGFQFGETEDYFLRSTPAAAMLTAAAMAPATSIDTVEADGSNGAELSPDRGDANNVIKLYLPLVNQ